MMFCPYCGTQMLEDMRFCPKCGKECSDYRATYTYTHEVSVNRTSNYCLEEPPARHTRKSPAIFLAILAVLIVAVAFLFVPDVKEILVSKINTTQEIISFSNNPEEIANKSSSVVKIYCYDKNGDLYSTGSGFVMFESNTIITNYHVIEQEAYTINVETDGGLSFPIDLVLAYDDKKDIAILKTRVETSLTPLEYAESNSPIKGEKVVAIGSPLGLKNSVSDGVFSAILENDGFDLIQFTASISHGSSGGPLFNDAGCVMGITSASFIEGQNLNLAVPIQYVCELWESKNAQQAMTVESFYNTFPHVYSAEYVLANQEKLKDQNIIVGGYISYTYGYILDGQPKQSIGLVADEENVLGEVFTLEHWDYGMAAKTFEHELDGISICMYFDDGYMDVDTFLDTFVPGKYVECSGSFGISTLVRNHAVMSHCELVS